MPAALRSAPEDAFPVCGGFFLLSRWSLRGHNEKGNRENPLRSHRGALKRQRAVLKGSVFNLGS